MPTAWSAGEHDVKNFAHGSLVVLRCKCGWESDELGPDFFQADERWRNVAQMHIENS